MRGTFGRLTQYSRSAHGAGYRRSASASTAPGQRASGGHRWQRPSTSPIEALFWERAKPLIPELQREVEIRPYRVDFLVPSQKLIIELYGYKWHAGQEKRISDAARERDLMRMGYRVMTFMGAEITRDVDRCVRQTGQMLLALSAEPGPTTQDVLPRAVTMPVVARAHPPKPEPAPVLHPVTVTPQAAPSARPHARRKPRSAFGLSRGQIVALVALGALFVVATVMLGALIGFVVAALA